MPKKFVVSIHGTPAQDNLVTEELQKRSFGVWHWIPSAWLVSSVPDGYTPRILYDELCQNPQIRDSGSLVIIEVEGPTKYWGHAAKAGWEWMSRYWGTSG